MNDPDLIYWSAKMRRKLKNPHIGSDLDDPDDFDECCVEPSTNPQSTRPVGNAPTVRCCPPKRHRPSKDRKYIKPSSSIEAEALNAKGSSEMRFFMRLHVDTSDMNDPVQIAFYNGMAQALAILTRTRPKYWSKK